VNLLIAKNGFWFNGDLTDLITLLANYPPDTTLAEFIRLNLH